MNRGTPARRLACSFAALFVVAGPAARAQDLPAAHDFVVKLYAAYHGKGPDYLGRQAGAVFAPSLLQLIRDDAARTPAGEVGALDGDPICDCQDFGISRVEVQVAGGPAGQARATVHFLNFAQPQTVRLDLMAVDGHWRVSDVHTSSTPSLVALLKHSVSHSRK